MSLSLGKYDDRHAKDTIDSENGDAIDMIQNTFTSTWCKKSAIHACNCAIDMTTCGSLWFSYYLYAAMITAPPIMAVLNSTSENFSLRMDSSSEFLGHRR